MFSANLSIRICVVSLVRLKGLIFWSVIDSPYENTMAIICTSLESTLGIICACMVVMRPLFGRIFPDRLKYNKTTNKLSNEPSTTSDFKLTRIPGWIHPNMPLRGLGGNGAELQQTLGPGRFQRLEDICPLTPGTGLTMPTNTTTVEVGSAASAYGDQRESHPQLPQRSLSPGSIMVRKEWGIDSWMV